MPKNIEPDEFGRLRVRDEDTGHERSIPAAELPHGNYAVLDEPASDPVTSDPVPPKLPPEHAPPKSLSRSTTPNSGQQAGSVKENDDA